MEKQAGRKYYPALSGLRFIFIMMIVVYHCWPLFAKENPGAIASFFRENGGSWGNGMFFMISGFLMGAHYQEKIRCGGTELWLFLRNRLRKLYPQYLSSMYVCVLFNLCVTGFAYVNLKNILLNSLMMATGWMENIYQYNSPQWFAGVLLQCYIVFYLICTVSKHGKRYYGYGCAAMIIWGYILMTRNWDVPFCYFWNGEGYFSFFIGCLVFEFCSTESIEGKTKVRIAEYGLVFVGIFFLLSYFVGFEVLSGEARFSLMAFVCPLILLASVQLKFPQYLLGNPFARALGSLSTSIFYWHIPLYQVVYFLLYGKGYFFNESSMVRCAAYFVLLAIICTFAHWLFDYKLPQRIKAKA